MNIYLISQTINCDYDAYDGAVVIAKSIADAKTIHPDANGLPMPMHAGGDLFKYRTWVSDAKDVTAEYVGRAKPDAVRGVVLASFNAG